MNERMLKIELSRESPLFGCHYYAELELPAKEHQLRDALEQVRVFDVSNADISFSILACPILPELTEIRLDSPTLQELNFFAKRLAILDENERIVFQAAAPMVMEEEPISIKTLINTTYGLCNVPVVSNISTDTQLGQFVIENDLHDDIAAIPEQSLYLLDKQQMGRLQRRNDGGVFVENRYVAAGAYELPEVYDGEHLSETISSEQFVFRLLISPPYRKHSSEWITMPMTRAKADLIVRIHNDFQIEDFVCYDFGSSIPQITLELFGNMTAFDQLNAIAQHISSMSIAEHVTFKAALEAEQPQDIGGALDILEHLHEYEFSPVLGDPDDYFKAYLAHHLSSRFDRKWLDGLPAINMGMRLLERTGAEETRYGIISRRGGTLYEPVPFDEPQYLTCENIPDPPDTEEGTQIGGMQL